MHCLDNRFIIMIQSVLQHYICIYSFSTYYHEFCLLGVRPEVAPDVHGEERARAVED